LRLYLLKLLDEAPRHGYDVIRLLQDKFLGVYSPSPGTIYPRLARLEEEGLVTHETIDGKKVYKITEAGRAELNRRLDDLADLEDELAASVRDIAMEISRDVRETVRNLRDELTWAVREAGRSGRGAGAGPGTDETARPADARPYSADHAPADATPDGADAAPGDGQDARGGDGQDARGGDRAAWGDATAEAGEVGASGRAARASDATAGEAASGDATGGQAADGSPAGTRTDRTDADAAGETAGSGGGAAGQREASGAGDAGGAGGTGGSQAGDAGAAGDSRAGGIGGDSTDQAGQRQDRSGRGDWRDWADWAERREWNEWVDWAKRQGWGEWASKQEWKDWAKAGKADWAQWAQTSRPDWLRGGGFRDRRAPRPDLVSDLEHLAAAFAREIRGVARQAENLSDDAVGNLGRILFDTLNRIRTEVFRTPEPGRAPESGQSQAPESGQTDAPKDPSGPDAPGSDGGDP
jgi:DNA-binding PadR family transcriptional regulator